MPNSGFSQEWTLKLFPLLYGLTSACISTLNYGFESLTLGLLCVTYDSCKYMLKEDAIVHLGIIKVFICLSKPLNIRASFIVPTEVTFTITAFCGRSILTFTFFKIHKLQLERKILQSNNHFKCWINAGTAKRRVVDRWLIAGCLCTLSYTQYIYSLWLSSYTDTHHSVHICVLMLIDALGVTQCTHSTANRVHLKSVFQ